MPQRAASRHFYLGAILLACVAGVVSFAQWSQTATADETETATVSDADRSFWSFTKAKRPDVPTARGVDRLRTPVDSFLLNRLEADGLSFSNDADRRTLIRRVALDLTGVPPTQADVADFLADTSEASFDRLVDRLLASPQFGERWGRHWLDVVGFVDTVGFDVDATLIITSEGKWRYRDYVIDSLNADKPYDQFIVEQIAGDETVNWQEAEAFTPEILERLIATGYLRNAQDLTHEDVGNIPENHFNILNDTLEIVGSSLLGLTLNCARCHTHKFDPIPHTDYYRLMAALTPAYNPNDWKVVFPYDAKAVTRDLADVSPRVKSEIDAHNAAVDKKIAELKQPAEAIRGKVRARLLETKLASLPEPIRADTKTAIETPADKRTEVQNYLAGKFQQQLEVKAEEIPAACNETEKSEIAKVDHTVADCNLQKRSYGKIQALYDVGPPPATRLLKRGDYHTPGEEMTPGMLSVLCESGKTDLHPAKSPNPHTSGRRLALAQWLTAPETPAASLVARVMVNRVWKHLFGRGIVATPENFGVMGDLPTHPELLEWLSVEFMHNEWRLKPLVKLIVSSTAYRQSAVPSLETNLNNFEADVDGSSGQPNEQAKNPHPQPLLPQGEGSNTKGINAISIDPDNRLLWRMRLKRLESEIIRDSVLAVSGSLEPSMGGAPVMLESQPDGMVVVAEKTLKRPDDKFRRSVYLLTRRTYQPSMLTVFDQPVVSTNCTSRTTSAVPTQSLTMLNSQYVYEQSERLASRIELNKPASHRECVAVAFDIVLGRPPGDDETKWCEMLVERQSELYRKGQASELDAAHKALLHLCHTLLNTSEFLYVP